MGHLGVEHCFSLIFLRLLSLFEDFIVGAAAHAGIYIVYDYRLLALGLLLIGYLYSLGFILLVSIFTTTL